MRIGICSFTYYPNEDGTSRACQNMVRALVESNHSVTIMTLDPQINISEYPQGVTIKRFNIHGGPLPRYQYKGEINEFIATLKKSSFDLIIFNGYNLFDVIADILNQFKIPVILVSHGYSPLLWVPTNKFPFGLFSLFCRVIRALRFPVWVRKLKKIIFLSSKADLVSFFDVFLAKIFNAKNIDILPNCVDDLSSIQNNLSFRNKFGIQASSILFLCVANYSRRKNQELALAAYRKANLSNSVLVFIGSAFNDYAHHCIELDNILKKSYADGRVIFLERVSRELTTSAIKEADCCVLSATQEAQPIFLLESMSASVPWIALDAGCIKELEGGKCVKNIHQMIEAMQLFYAEKKLRIIYGNKGKSDQINKYSYEIYKKKLIDIVDKLASISADSIQTVKLT